MMKKTMLLVMSVLLMSCIGSCKEDKGILIGKDDPVEFNPDKYTISAAGGEFITSEASIPFSIHGARRIPEDHTKDPYYPANDKGDFVETDFFTAEKTADNRMLKFSVQPNTTGKERTYTVILEAGNSGGRFSLMR